MANPDLGWERTTQYNLGIDYGFLNNRLTGSIDAYKTKTNDLLLLMSIPITNGYGSTYANVGKTSGWGIDLQLQSLYKLKIFLGTLLSHGLWIETKLMSCPMEEQKT